MIETHPAKWEEMSGPPKIGAPFTCLLATVGSELLTTAILLASNGKIYRVTEFHGANTIWQGFVS
jgi:hypothetical protein